MSLIEALVLGLLQGLTEFLPVSSSGHLVIAQTLFGLQEPPLFFDTVLHGGTLLAVLWYFRRQLIHLSRSLSALLVLATIPAIFFGLIFHHFENLIFSSLLIVGLGLIVTGIELLSIPAHPSVKLPQSKMSPKDALKIGLFQSLAILPGISRSGSTISSALRLGYLPQTAFTFSFLLSIPAILGAIVLQSVDLLHVAPPASGPLIIGFVVAAISGLLSLKLLDVLIHQHRFRYFAYYCITVGTLALIYSFVTPH